MKKFFVFLATFFTFFVTFTIPSFAKESIKNYDASIIVSKNGNLNVQEKIIYDFGDNQHHGIYRYIPTLSQVGDLYKISSIKVNSVTMDGKQEYYYTDYSNDQAKIQIGESKVLISGIHTYVINYDVSNIMGNFPDHDELYWNVTGNGWGVPIEESKVLVATNFNIKPGKTICYTGVEGSTAQKCSVTEFKNEKEIAVKTQLSSGEGLTIVVAFPPDTFPETIYQKQSPEQINNQRIWFGIIVTYIFLNFILAPYLLYWYLKHKHKNRFGPVSVNFDIPEYPKGVRLSPAEAGTIDNAKLDKDDIIGTVFDLAVRKYIFIEEIKEKNFLGIGSHADYKITKKKDFADLSAFEKKLMQLILKGEKSIELSSVRLIYDDFADLEDLNFDSLIKKKIYTKNAGAQMSSFLGTGIVLTLTLSFFMGPLLIFFSRKLNGRTQLGDELDYKIDGLKLFLKNMKPEYKWQAEKVYVVEQMIPYAISLGYIKEFMQHQKLINPDYSPTFYSGSGNFYSIYPAFSSTFTGGISTSQSSGFSGGSSGGGGGGGGGGSW